MTFTPSQRGTAKGWVILLVLIAAAVVYFYVYPKMKQAKRFHAVRAEAEELAAKCRARGQGSDQTRFPPKVLLWDPDTDAESPANAHLPESLRAERQDDLGTLVLVLGLTKEETTEYIPLEGTTMGGPTEVRYIYTLGAVAWPKRRIGGTFEVVIDPPGMRGNTRDERGGNWFDRGLADWVRDRARTQ